jgi:predicted component of type VI protein secretion system
MPMDQAEHPYPDPGNVGLRVTILNEVDGRTTDLLFNQFPIRVGRNPMNDLVLSHQYVSQWHAVIGTGQGGMLTITQVGSSNSVVVGERKLQPNEEAVLTGQEAIRIIPFVLHVQLVALPSELRKGPATGTLDSVAYMQPIDDQSVSGMDANAELERAALKLIDRLSNKFLARTLQTPKELASFIGRVEAALGVFFRYFVALQKGQEQFRQALDIKALGGKSRNAVEETDDANELAALLLGTPGSAALGALESAFKNVLLHQVALVNGLMAGVRSLLAQLSPEVITAEAGKEHRSPGVRQLWETYEQIHRDLAEEDNQTFETIFGPQFGEAYANLFGKKAAKKR